jgi:CO/xanthine dehydrogenase FAD-binding subunit
MMQHFDYLRPQSLPEALDLLGQFGPKGMCVAGGTDVWVNVRSGKVKPAAVVSLNALPSFRFLLPEGHALTLGAGTRHADVEDSEWVARHFPALQQACEGVGSRQVRNVATVGGNLCNAAPCADSGVALLLYDATLLANGKNGARELTLDQFFVGPGETVLEPGEILTEIRLPDPGERTFSGYWKHTRRRGVELPLLGVGCRVTLSAEGIVKTARISLGVCAPMPKRSYEAEKVLEGKPLTEETVLAAAETAAANALVRDTWRGRAWYRREMVRVLIPRVLAHAGAYERRPA